ncbi:MAG: NAD(P)H-binding protein [candidate division Zixibacteria bacterium]|nr:NAD(P)H-binding protein [candidate division Zixibacteria bacterium]
MSAKLKIAVTGGSGFVGSHIIQKALSEGFRVRALSRTPGALRDVDYIKGNIVSGEGLDEFLEGVDVVINSVGIIKETKGNKFEGVHYGGVVNILETCRRKNVNKIIQISALGTGPEKENMYFKTKYMAEREIQSSGMNYVIFQPSLIFGPGDGFVNMLAGILKFAPVFPIFGDGSYLLQPVSIHDLATAVVKRAEDINRNRSVYQVCGPEKLSYERIVRMIIRQMGKKRLVIHVPIGLVRLGVNISEKLNLPSPLSSEQLDMLLTGSVCDDNSFTEDFNINLVTLEEGMKEYIS